MSTNFVFREILKMLFRDHLNTSQWGFVFPVKPILSQKRQFIREAIICISYPTSALFKICSVMLIQTTKYWSWGPKAFLSLLFNFQGSIRIPIERRGGPGPAFATYTFRDGPCTRVVVGRFGGRCAWCKDDSKYSSTWKWIILFRQFYPKIFPNFFFREEDIDPVHPAAVSYFKLLPWNYFRQWKIFTFYNAKPFLPRYFVFNVQ